MEIIAFALGLLCGLFLMDKFAKHGQSEQTCEQTQKAEEERLRTRTDREWQNFFTYDGTATGQIKIEDEKEG